MTPERWESIKNAFERAIESDALDRPRLLAEACGGDPELIAEATRLLAQHDEMGNFLTEPAVTFSGVLTAGTIIAGRYEIECLLGRGGMGEVYRAKDRLLHENVALKTIRADLSETAATISSLEREIQSARKVTHPNVCRVFDLGVHNFPNSERPPLQFLSMELLEGETLQARIERQGRLAEGEALPLAIQMAEGLEAAHAAGIIHRDFKSANVIVIPGKDAARAVITDFGLARRDHNTYSTATATISGRNILVGTIGYMSPEQLTGGPVTSASDIYSLGIVLFEMMTGQLPFRDSHFIQAAVQRVSGHPPSVRQLAPDLDGRWERVIRRCLEVQPESRISPAKAVADALRRPGWRISKPNLTRRQWWGAAAVLAAAGIAPIAWYSRHPYVPRPEAERWYEQGVEHVYETTYDAARKALEQAIAIDPDYGPSHAYLAFALHELDYPERAREEILAALALLERKRHSADDTMRVKAAQFFISANYDLAQPLIDELGRRAQGRKKQAANIERGMLALYRSRVPDALAAFAGVLATDPSDAAATLRIATVYARQRQNDLALRSFDQSEKLFRAANNIDGVTETLFQKGVFLTRTNRSTEAISTFEKGVAIARDTGDVHHEVRLQLALGTAYVNLGQMARGQEATEAGIQKALDGRMEHAAAVGLLDLGNVYLLRGQPELADKYYLQGLEFARQTKGQREEMRALLSLASLRVQSDRPKEAIEFIQRAVPYYEQGKFRRELSQSLILLGRAQAQLGSLNDAEQTLRRAVPAAEQLGDAEQSGLAHGNLSRVFLERGDFPSARTEQERALQLYASGLSSGFGFATLAVIESRAGLFDKAAAALSRAEACLAKLEGGQNQLRAAILSAHAEIVYSRRQWVQASRFVQQELALPASEADFNARLLGGLIAIRTGKLDAGLSVSRGVIQQYEQKERRLAAASGSLMLAEALWGNGQQPQAQEFAKASLRFFEPLENWEAVWRCRRVLQDPRAADALDRFRQILGPEMFDAYRKRPILEKLLP